MPLELKAYEIRYKSGDIPNKLNQSDFSIELVHLDFVIDKKSYRSIKKYEVGNFDFIKVDIDRDGYQDLIISSCATYTCKVQHIEVWLYSPSSQEIFFNEEMSDATKIAPIIEKIKNNEI